MKKAILFFATTILFLGSLSTANAQAVQPTGYEIVTPGLIPISTPLTQDKYRSMWVGYSDPFYYEGQYRTIKIVVRVVDGFITHNKMRAINLNFQSPFGGRVTYYARGTIILEPIQGAIRADGTQLLELVCYVNDLLEDPAVAAAQKSMFSSSR